MRAIRDALSGWTRAIARDSAHIGQAVRIDGTVLDRGSDLSLWRPGLWSPNRACRMVRAADGWIAVNLAREDDRATVAAWMGRYGAADPWRAVIAGARTRTASDLVAGARLLGLPVSRVGEAAGPGVLRHGMTSARRTDRRPVVIDMTSLWAGPLCAGLLARAGADVTRLESRARPDPTRIATPDFDARLNAGKRHVALDFSDPADRARLAEAIDEADILVTSARPRAFEGLGIAPDAVFARNPALIWVAITGHGWAGDGADRIAFGDDAAAAGGLVRWTAGGAPRFAGDALADPLTGLAAAAAVMAALAAGEGGVLLDVALARVAAEVAS